MGNGRLVCDPVGECPQPTGPYEETCTLCGLLPEAGPCMFYCSCDGSGEFRATGVDLYKCTNLKGDGALACADSPAPGPAPPPPRKHYCEDDPCPAGQHCVPGRRAVPYSHCCDDPAHDTWIRFNTSASPDVLV